MNKQLASLLVTLLIVPFGAVSAAADSDKVTEPQVTPTDLQPAPAANNDNKAPEKAEIEKAAAADKAVDKAVEPITGAFGIPLGEHFEASMVAKVLNKQEHSYKAQGTTKLKGQLLRIEPVKPDDRFQQYSLKTTDEGIIYAIQGDYQYKAESDKAMPDEANQDEARPDEAMQVEAMQVEAKAKAKAKGSGKGAGKPGNRQPANAMQLTCKAAVKTLAKELEARYGKPRGQGWDGLWYTFRQFSDTANKGVKLYGHRCRTGMYSIIYTDNKVQRAMQSGKAKSSAEAGTPATGNAPKQP